MTLQELIKQEATTLYNKYIEEYTKYSKETGNIIHGAHIRAEFVKKAQFAKSFEDLLACKRCYEISAKAMSAEKKMNGFRFGVDAMEELINQVKHKWSIKK